MKLFGYDLVLLDWGLPDTTGLELLKLYRANGGTTPIIFMTGHGEITEKEKGFDGGADDYVTKPVDFRELAARIRALLRRKQAFVDPV